MCKETEYFNNKIKESKHINDFKDEIVSNFVDGKKLLNNEIIKCGMNPSKIGSILGKSNYVYEITSYSNNKKPNRDLLISILIITKSEIEVIDEILQKFSYSKLYAKVLRDAIIIYGIKNNYDLNLINVLLVEENLEALI